MTRNWHNPDRTPDPAELAAWADGELDAGHAAQVESWLAANPDAAAEIDDARRLVRLYRDHPPAEPSPDAWASVRRRIDAGLVARDSPRRPRWPWLLVVTLSAAAVLGGVLIAGALLPWKAGKVTEPVVVLPPGDDNDEPFAVAVSREVHIISMDVRDADRVLMGQPLLGPVEFASDADIELVKAEADAEEGTMPVLQRGRQVPMVVPAPAADDDDGS